MSDAPNSEPTEIVLGVQDSAVVFRSDTGMMEVVLPKMGDDDILGDAAICASMVNLLFSGSKPYKAILAELEEAFYVAVAEEEEKQTK